jgi:hypothetical protein
VVLLQGKDAGTAPTSAAVVAGQTVQVALRAVPLGAPLRIDPDPPTAVVAIDGVVLGPGPWQGRLPLGVHQISASEEGYLPRTQALDADSKGTVRVELGIDEKHPRWRREERARFLLEAHGGYGLGGALGSDAEARCAGGCAGRRGPSGILAGVRGVYLLPVGVAFELGGGYLHASTEFQRTVPASRAVPGQGPHVYELRDAITVTGPYAALGIGYRRRMTRALRLDARIALGAHFASGRNELSGEARRGGEREAITLERGGRSGRAVNFFAMPELGASLQFGRVHASLALGFALFLLDGPPSTQGDLQIVDGATRCGGDPARLACAAADAAVAGEKPYGPFSLWFPQVGVGYTF